MRRALTWIKRIVAVAIVLLAAGVAALFAWVATGPRAADFLTPYIEQAFSSVDSRYHVKINQTSLVWDRWRHPIDIRLHGVAVLTQDGGLFSAFSDISIGLDVWMLPLGQVLPTSIIISHPALGLYQNDDRSLNLGFGEAPAPAATPAVDTSTPPKAQSSLPASAILTLLLAPDRNSSLRALHYVAINDANFNVGNSYGVFFEARDVDVEANRYRDGSVELLAQGHVRYDDYESSVNVRFNFDKDSPTVDGHVEFDGLMPGSLAALFSDEPLWRMLNLPMSGAADMQFGRDAQLQQLHFNVQGGSGTLHSDWMEAPMAVGAVSVEGQISNQFHDIQVNHFMANLNEVVLSGDGVVTLKNDDVAIRANLNAKNIAASKIHVFWPPKLSPMSREWVIENIISGRVPEADAHVNIQFGDLAKPALPKEDIDATIALENAKIRYLPGHPEVTKVMGAVHVDGVSLSADITSGEYMKATHISKGTLNLPDLNADNPHIVVNFAAETTAKDAVAFLKLPRVNHASRLNLNEDTIEGAAQVKATVGFDFFAPHDAKGKPIGEPDIDYDIAADLKNVNQPEFLSKFDVKDGNGTLTLNNKELIFSGSAQVNGAQASQANVKYVFKPEDGFDTFIDVVAQAPASSLARFGYPGSDYLTGMLGVKANVKQGAEIEQSKATLDLTNASVSMVKLGWSKPFHEPATLDVTAEKKEGVLTIPSFRLKGKDVDASGSAALNKDFTEISKLDLGKTIIGATDLQRLNFEPIDGGFKLEIEGASVDASGWFAPTPGQPSHFSFEHFPAVQFSADISHVILGKGHELSAMKGTLTCDAQRCTDANIAAVSGGKPVNFRILRNPKGSRQLSLHAQDAGSFLKALDVVPGMEGGDLTITGTYDDSGKSSTLAGKINITEHVIKHAPILGKILSLASLTGFIDTLEGNGIHFKRLVAPFTLHNDVITFTDAKTHGDAIGITMEGTITMPEGKLNLQGTVVPSYSLNTLVGKVPLVGQVLTGGEGQGVFAARYSVKGTQDKPDVSVNPLSILTPGFLRGVFDIMDKPDKVPDDDTGDADDAK